MIFWKRDKTYHLMSANERRIYLLDSLSSGEYSFLEFLSVLLNAIAALTLYYFFGFNLIVFGIGFIICDIVFNIFDQLIFITIPYRLSLTKDKGKLKRRLDKMTKQLEKTKSKIKTFRELHCNDCTETISTWTSINKNAPGYVRANRCNCCKCEDMDRLFDKKQRLQAIIKAEERYIEQLEEERTVKKSVQEEKTETQTTTDGGEKYFADISSKFSKLIEKEKLYFLIGLRKNTKTLSQILKNKPALECTIPVAIYSKLDDILETSYKISKLNQTERRQQSEEIKKVVNPLIKETQMLISQINRVRLLDIKEERNTDRKKEE